MAAAAIQPVTRLPIITPPIPLSGRPPLPRLSRPRRRLIVARSRPIVKMADRPLRIAPRRRTEICQEAENPARRGAIERPYVAKYVAKSSLARAAARPGPLPAARRPSYIGLTIPARAQPGPQESADVRPDPDRSPVLRHDGDGPRP